MIEIAFICTGNICRSVMAEAFFRQQATTDIEAGLFRVDSAGLAAKVGQVPPDEVISLMAEKGLDVSGYRAKQVEASLLQRADLLLTMTLHNSQRLLILDQGAAEKIFTLKEFVLGGEKDGSVTRLNDVYLRLQRLKRWIRLEELEGRLWEVSGDQPGGSLHFKYFRDFHLYDQMLTIDDPLGQSESFMRRCAEEIEEYVGRLYRLLRPIESERRGKA